MAIQAQVYQENLGFPWFGSQDLHMENNANVANTAGCGLNLNFNLNPQSSGIPQKQLEQQRLYVQLQLQLQKNNRSLNSEQRLERSSSQSHNPMPHPQSLGEYIGQQGREIDQLLQLQNERLRVALQEQRKQQMAAFLKKIESKTQVVLNQKDQEIAQAAQRTAELQDLLQKLEMESQAWQRVAQENEAVVVSLNNTLEELMRDRACSSAAAGGPQDSVAESCCELSRGKWGGGCGEEEVGTGEGAVVGASGAGMACRSCSSRGSCMLFLPCRHLCSCKACEAFLGFCPVCKTAKKASVEALIF